MLRYGLLLGLFLGAACTPAVALTPDELGVVFNRNDAASTHIAQYYAQRRRIPTANIIGLEVPDRDRISRLELKSLRTDLLQKLPTGVQSLLLVWSRPYAVECMSITTALAAGYQPGFCEPGCALTSRNPLYDSHSWLPADTIGWLPAMLLPSTDEALARAIIDRGIQADGTAPSGSIYLVRTQDNARNARADGYANTKRAFDGQLRVVDLAAPEAAPVADIIAYFTGAVSVSELPRLHFRPGAVADHLTSFGGILDGTRQMSILAWLRQGATASYGTVSEPCAYPGKFPSPLVFLGHYLRGDTLLEAYWKSVAMPGQGLFIGEPLARPYPRS